MLVLLDFLILQSLLSNMQGSNSNRTTNSIDYLLDIRLKFQYYNSHSQKEGLTERLVVGFFLLHWEPTDP